MPAFLGFSRLVFSGHHQMFSLRPVSLCLLSRVGRVTRALLLSLFLQILLNYLPVERASWTSILAKQR